MAGSERGRLLSFILVAGVALFTAAVSIAASVTYANTTAGRLHQQQQAACAAAADLGSVPIPDKPPPSKLAISLVTDERGQWFGLGCPGTLPVPPGLAKWAAHYGIPVNGKRP